MKPQFSDKSTAELKAMAKRRWLVILLPCIFLMALYVRVFAFPHDPMDRRDVFVLTIFPLAIIKRIAVSLKKIKAELNSRNAGNAEVASNV